MAFGVVFLIISSALVVPPRRCVSQIGNPPLPQPSPAPMRFPQGVPFMDIKRIHSRSADPLNHYQATSLHNGSSEQTGYVGVYFEAFDLEYSPGCDKDYLVIIERVQKESSLLWGPVCGLNHVMLPNFLNVMLLFQPRGNLDMIYSTDYEVESKGFNGEFLGNISSNKRLPCTHFIDSRMGWISLQSGARTGIPNCKFYLTAPIAHIVGVTIPAPLDSCGHFMFYDNDDGVEIFLGEHLANRTSKIFSIQGNTDQMIITLTPCQGFNGNVVANYTAITRESVENSLCPNGYKLFEGHCYSYKTSPKSLTWEKAESNCVAENAHLVSIQSRREMRFLNRMINRKSTTDCDKYYPLSGVFLGLQSKTGSNRFNWSDGSAYVYSEWYGPDIYGYNTYEIPDALESIVHEDMLQPIPDQTMQCTIMMPFYPKLGLPHGRSRWANWAKTPCQRPVCCMAYICKKPGVPVKEHLNLPTSGLPEVTISSALPGGVAKSRDPNKQKVHCPEKWVYISGRCFYLYRLATFALHGVAVTDKTIYIKHSTSWHWTLEGKHDLTFKGAVQKCHSVGGEVAKIDGLSLQNSEFLQFYHRTWAKEVQWVNDSAILVSNTALRSRKFIDLASPWLRSLNGDCKRMSIEIEGLSYWAFEQPYENCLNDNNTGALFALCEAGVLIEMEECSRHHYKCKDGTCISIRNVCDGDNNCLGGEDEVGCVCGPDSYRCTDKSCIPISKVCDHVSDCKDGSDEDRCVFPVSTSNDNNDSPTSSSAPSSCDKDLRCYTGICVPSYKKDDRYPDCPGLSQEDEPLEPIPNVAQTTCGVGVFSYIINYTYCSSLDQIRCSPGHVKCYPRYLTCVHDKKQMEISNACRHFEHLQQCGTYECPSMFKCPNTYCIPLRQVCDGERDCPRGEDEDETRCRNYTCPGQFRCRGEKQCLHQSEVCNGVVNCKHSDDDELFCDINATLPTGCLHKGYFLDCAGISLTSIPVYSFDIRGLSFAKNNLSLTNGTFRGYHLLVKLNVSFNNLQHIPPGIFLDLKNVMELDLSYNQIVSLYAKSFIGLLSLKRLVLEGNGLETIESGAFEGVSSLQILDLSLLKLNMLTENTFRGLGNLSVLNISHNEISTVGYGAFKGLPRLQTLDMSSNRKAFVHPEAFKELNAETLRSDRFSICCLAEREGNVDVCYPPQDEFSSCSDMLQSSFLQVSIWVMGIVAFVGNVVAISYWLRKKDTAASSIFVLNLAMADLLMAVYLLIIASADIVYRGIYASYSVQWMSGGMCKFAGLLSMLSSEMSVSVLVLITTDRFLSIVFAMKVQRIGKRKSILMTGLSWLLFLILSLVPLIETGYFKDFYGHNSVCLPFTLSRADFGGREYAFVIFVFFNFVAFLFIFSAYAAIIRHVYNSRKNSGRQETNKDVQLLKKVSLILITDFLCWAPVSVLGILSMGGVYVSPEISSWIAVFILPINSAMNPILYTLANVKMCGVIKKKLKKPQRSTLSGSSKDHTVETRM